MLFILASFKTFLIPIMVAEIAINVALLVFMNVQKPYIVRDRVQDISSYYIVYFLLTCGLKGYTHYIWSPTSLSDFSLLRFLVASFIFEVIFDLCHYWCHRLSHMYMYRFHKIHHIDVYTHSLSTYVMHPIDFICVYVIPFSVAYNILKDYIDPFTYSLITIYLTYQEIAGHLGKEMRPTSSFAQCIWLPRLLGIELYTEDHDLHHRKLHCNYGKRLSLWDKVFGTYLDEY